MSGGVTIQSEPYHPVPGNLAILTGGKFAEFVPHNFRKKLYCRRFSVTSIPRSVLVKKFPHIPKSCTASLLSMSSRLPAPSAAGPICVLLCPQRRSLPPPSQCRNPVFRIVADWGMEIFVRLVAERRGACVRVSLVDASLRTCTAARATP